MVVGSAVRGFFKKKFNVYLFIALFLLGFALIASEHAIAPVEVEGIALHYFYLPTCPHCHEPVLPHHLCPQCGTYKGRTIIKKEES